MFSIAQKSADGFDIIVLKDNTSNTSVEMLPACGAILHAFNIQQNGFSLNLIDNYSSKEAFDNRLEALGFKGCKLSPFVCRMRDGRYTFGENTYQVSKFFLGKHALHGLIYDAAYELIATSASEEAASAELLYRYNAADSGYPFKYDCRVLYELIKENELSVKTFIKNNETTAIPMADGWHPYFSFGGKIDGLQMQFNCNEMLEFDDELLPTGKKNASVIFNELTEIGNTHLDNSFLIDSKQTQPVAILRDPVKKLQIEIITDKSYPILQVYTPDHRNSIAIENLSAAPDAFNNNIGLTTLAAGKEAVFNTTYRVSAF